MADNEHSIATYLSDMLALERHIRVPFETQLKDEDFSKFSSAKPLLQRLVDLNQTHIDSLSTALDILGGHEASPIKSTVSTIEGFFAGVIDMMRKTKVSKALRDDYTALSLCTAGYTMLTATANAMGHADVATIAQRHLGDYAQRVIEIAQILPVVVVEELRATGLRVETGTIPQSVNSTQETWSGAAR